MNRRINVSDSRREGIRGEIPLNKDENEWEGKMLREVCVRGKRCSRAEVVMCAQAHVLIRQSTREKKRHTGKYETSFVPLPRRCLCLSAPPFDWQTPV